MRQARQCSAPCHMHVACMVNEKKESNGEAGFPRTGNKTEYTGTAAQCMQRSMDIIGKTTTINLIG